MWIRRPSWIDCVLSRASWCQVSLVCFLFTLNIFGFNSQSTHFNVISLFCYQSRRIQWICMNWLSRGSQSLKIIVITFKNLLTTLAHEALSYEIVFGEDQEDFLHCVLGANFVHGDIVSSVDLIYHLLIYSSWVPNDNRTKRPKDQKWKQNEKASLRVNIGWYDHYTWILFFISLFSIYSFFNYWTILDQSWKIEP